MQPPLSESSTAFQWHKNSGQVAVPQERHETTIHPLDDVLQVDFVDREEIRNSVRTFLFEHCRPARGISFIAGRGKLIAELADCAGQRLSFGDVVKKCKASCGKSELPAIRRLDARELARVLCLPGC